MGVDRVASLPMYDFPPLRAAHDAFWGAVAERLNSAGLRDVPRELTRDVGHTDVWRDPSLLFAQGCEYPLAKSFADRVRLVATPMYSAAGCEGARYRSAIVVRGSAIGSAGGAGRANRIAKVVNARSRADDAAAAGGAFGGAAVAPGGAVAGGARGGEDAAVGGDDCGLATLANLRGRRCVINELESNSGMNLLRAAVAPLAMGGRFFGSVAVSGSHLRSVEMVATGEADVASVDCVSFELFQRLYPEVVRELRVLCWTPSSPCLPFITARSASDATVQALRSALADVFDDRRLAAAREQLLLTGVDLEPKEGFEEVLALERAAMDAGYPAIR